MKNKEIEELLNFLKDEDKYFDEEEEVLVNCGELILEKEDIDLLLSYIEQLENNREKEYVLVGRMQLKTRDYIHQLEKEKRQLENNRDKAIEIINIEKSKMEYAKYDSCLLLIEQVLKGDSDA